MDQLQISLSKEAKHLEKFKILNQRRGTCKTTTTTKKIQFGEHYLEDITDISSLVASREKLLDQSFAGKNKNDYNAEYLT